MIRQKATQPQTLNQRPFKIVKKYPPCRSQVWLLLEHLHSLEKRQTSFFSKTRVNLKGVGEAMPLPEPAAVEETSWLIAVALLPSIGVLWAVATGAKFVAAPD